MPYRIAKTLSAPDAAYLAGLIDGEGTIALTRRHACEYRHVVVSISSTGMELLAWAKETTGVGKITRKRTVSERHAPGLTYSVSNRQALDVLAAVAPYLRSYKRFRAALVLQHYLALTPRNGRYNATLADARRRFEDTFRAITVGYPHSGQEIL
ncbi:MAG: hypothetical protein MUF51_09945 [Vicinamibacteria bacterium]|jgi:hypothetical protein|nr:hypothetical protein [Vicinamibacteria bacterium]